MNDKDDVPMIEQYKVDTTIVHTSKIVRDVKIIVAIVMVTIIAIVFIFVSNYNARTKDWLNTIAALQNTGVQNETVQQFAPP